MIVRIWFLVTASVVFQVGLPSATVKDEQTGLYFDPTVEVTLGTTEGRSVTGRITGIEQGSRQIRETTGAELVGIPLYRLDQNSRNYLRSLEPPFEVRSGTIRVPTPFDSPATVKVRYQTAFRNGKPAREAADLVYHAPYMRERNFFNAGYHLYLTREYGMTIFSFSIPGNAAELNDPEKGYPAIASGWPRFVFTVQKAVIDELGLPHRRLLILGNSAGARMAANMALAFPQWVEAVAFAGGGTYDRVPEEGSPVLWCVLQTVGDHPTPDNEHLVADLLRTDSYVVYGRFPPIWEDRGVAVHFNHSPSPFTQKTQVDFLAGVAALRRESGGARPDLGESAFGTSAATESFPNFPEDWPGYATWLEGLPSAEFAQRGRKRLLPLFGDSVEANGDRHSLLLSLPVSGKPRAAVLYAPMRKGGSVDPLHLLADRGVSAGGLELPDDTVEAPEAVAAALDRLHELMPDLPLYAVADEGSVGPVAQGIAASRARVTELLVTVAEEPSEHGPLVLPRPPPKDVVVIDARPNVAGADLASDHPFYKTPLAEARRITVEGDGDPQKGRRWLDTWEAVADRCR